MDIQKIFDSARFAQVGYVVNDIEKTKAAYAAILGVENPPICTGGEYEVTQAKVFGEPAPEADCKMAFFNLPSGVQFELIEPNEAPSVWRDHLNKYGEGIHHIAFTVDNADETVAKCLELGMKVEQEGNYGDNSGRYVYLDAYELLKCRVELLESFKK
ncbi:MAG: VOC family protein [Lachnospiraceae bacterium]|nr:VOC family protein [Lachnospiraceae bacterium]